MQFEVPTLVVGELRIRPWRDGDADRLVAAWADPAIQQGAVVPVDSDGAAARAWIAGADERAITGRAVDAVVVDSATDRVQGEVGFSRVDHDRQAAMIGWWVAAEHRGSGVASAAVTAFADWALGPAGLDALAAEIALENTASWRVAERSGFSVLREPTLDLVGVAVRRRSG